MEERQIRQILMNIDSDYIPHYHKCELGESIALMEKTGLSFCRFYWNADDLTTVYLRDVSVNAGNRNNGIGSYLLDMVENTCRSLQFKCCTTPVIYHSELMYFYEKHGYKYSAMAEDDIVWMAKCLHQ